MLHQLGTSITADMPVLGTDVPTGFRIADREVPSVATSPGSRYVLAVAGGAQASVRTAIATAAAIRVGKPDWREIATLDDQVMRDSSALVGDTLYYVTTRNEPNGEARRLALQPGATLADSKPVLSGRGVISASLFTQDGAYVFVSTPFAASRLWCAPDGGQAREVKLPFIGSAFFFNTSVDRRTATFAFDGFQQSTSSFRLDRGQLTSLGLDAATLPSAGSLKVEEIWATSADGARVPLTVRSRSKGDAMDINYLLAREQESLIRAVGSPSRSARAAHRGFAKAYGLLLQDSSFPHDRLEQAEEPAAEDVLTPFIAVEGAETWENEGGPPVCD